MTSFLLFSALFALSYAAEGPQARVVYGDDGRTDYYSYVAENGSNDPYAVIARESIVGLIKSSSLGFPNDDGVYSPSSSSLAQSNNLCPSERFGEQKTHSFCSGTLVDSTHVVTAGHCITSNSDCSTTKFVFNYYVTGISENGQPQYQTITTDDVYGCADFTSVVETGSNGNLDWAYVTLDREVLPSTGHAPVTLETSNSAMSNGQSIVMIGFPSGLPMKIEDGGEVRDPRNSFRDYFEATADAFGGNSGSGVFADSGSGIKMVGILVRGQTDYVNQGNCMVVNVLSDTNGDSGSFEDITYAYHAVPDCTSNSQCATEAICSSGRCVVPECLQDSDCGSNQICSERNLCIAAIVTQYFQMVGDCGVQLDRCVSSGNFPGVHGNNEMCTITIRSSGAVAASCTWDLEEDYDHILINGVDVESRSDVPASLSTGDSIQWSSDSSVSNGGWQLCFGGAPPSGTDCDNGGGNDDSSDGGYYDSSDGGDDSGNDGGDDSGTTITTQYFTMVGNCAVSGECVSSGNYPQNHADNEQCTVTVLQEGYTSPGSVWDLENAYDHVYINGVDVENAFNVPNSMDEGDSIQWSSDGSVNNGGWQVCFSDTPSNNGPDTIDTPYFSMTGDCQVSENCVSSMNYPGNHENRESCLVTVLMDASVTPGEVWTVENAYDHVYVAGEDVENRNAVPPTLSQGDTIQWDSDGSVTYGGWQLCFSTNVDCNGVPSGAAVVDACGVCGGDGQSCADCAGVPNGNAVMRDCGCNDNDSCRDCADVPNGNAVTDLCGVCDGDDSSCTSDWFVMTGDCQVSENCVSSMNYPGNHENRESCLVTVLMDASVTPGEVWTVENAYDHVYVAGEDVENRNAVPPTLSQGDTIQWDSDGSVTYGGWQLCFSEYVEPIPTLDPTEAPTAPVPTSDYFTFSGDCDIAGECISSLNYPNQHENRDACEIILFRSASVTPGPTWELENGYDSLLYIDNNGRNLDLTQASRVPQTMIAGDVLQWNSDGSVTSPGWQLCFSEYTEPEVSDDCEMVVLRTRRYGEEISFSISGDVTCSGSEFASQSRITTDCCVSPSQSITLRCEDSYGDGWHRGFITINEVNYCQNFRSGSLMEINISPYQNQYYYQE